MESSKSDFPLKRRLLKRTYAMSKITEEGDQGSTPKIKQSGDSDPLVDSQASLDALHNLSKDDLVYTRKENVLRGNVCVLEKIKHKATDEQIKSVLSKYDPISRNIILRTEYHFGKFFSKEVWYPNGTIKYQEKVKTYPSGTKIEYAEYYSNGSIKAINSDETGYLFKIDGLLFYTGDLVRKNGHLVPHGKGRMTFRSGNAYEGEFRYADPHGEGTYYKGDFMYRGKFENGLNLKKGEMIYIGEDPEIKGWKYKGEFKNGKPCREGEITYTNGNVYTGQVVDFQSHGKGILVSASGKISEGEFKEGRFIQPE